MRVGVGSDILTVGLNVKKKTFQARNFLEQLEKYQKYFDVCNYFVT